MILLLPGKRPPYPKQNLRNENTSQGVSSPEKKLGVGGGENYKSAGGGATFAPSRQQGFFPPPLSSGSFSLSGTRLITPVSCTPQRFIGAWRWGATTVKQKAASVTRNGPRPSPPPGRRTDFYRFIAAMRAYTTSTTSQRRRQ